MRDLPTSHDEVALLVSLATRHSHDRNIIDKLADGEAHDKLYVGVPTTHGAHDVKRDKWAEQGDAREDYEQDDERAWIIFAHGLPIYGEACFVT